LRAWICSYKQNWWLWSWFLIIYHLPDFIRDLKCFMHIFMFDSNTIKKNLSNTNKNKTIDETKFIFNDEIFLCFVPQYMSIENFYWEL
jgi:hypothetical protein